MESRGRAAEPSGVGQDEAEADCGLKFLDCDPVPSPQTTFRVADGAVAARGRDLWAAGPLARTLTGYEPRAGQLLMAEARTRAR